MNKVSDDLAVLLNECIESRKILLELNDELLYTCKGLRYYLENDPSNLGVVGMCKVARQVIAKVEKLKKDTSNGME